MLGLVLIILGIVWLCVEAFAFVLMMKFTKFWMTAFFVIWSAIALIMFSLFGFIIALIL